MLAMDRVMVGRTRHRRTAPAPLDDPRILGRDRAGAIGHAQALGDEFERAWNLYERPSWPGTPAGRAFFGGMGGSGIVGDYCVAVVREQGGIAAEILADCAVPASADERDVAVVTSYSGNTAEALAGFHAARERGTATFVVASGGQLLARAAQSSAPHIPLQYRSVPRAALPHMLAANLRVAEALGGFEGGNAAVAEAAAIYGELAACFAPTVATRENPAKQLALLIRERLPVVVAAGHLVPGGRRWKTQLSENAKRFAVAEVIPDLLHNTVEALYAQQGPAAPLVVLLSSPRYTDADREHVECLRALLRRRGVTTFDVETTGLSVLADLLEATAWADHVSIYAALAAGIDPTPTPAIDEVKSTPADSRPPVPAGASAP